MANELRKVIYCIHCGNETEMSMVASHKYEYKHYETFDQYIGPEHVASHIKTWQLYFCATCKEVTLILDDFNDYDNPETEIKQLYPEEHFKFSGVPNEIASSFKAAIECQHIDGAICAIALRRTLEMICKNKGETKGTLGPKLKSLSEKGILPSGISNIAMALKNIGDEAAHGDDISFPDEIVEPLIEFTRMIIDYLYVIPAKLKEVQAEIENRDKNCT